jgi:quinol monooxygenase YgiN
MTKLAIVATAEIAPGRMDEAVTLLMAHRERRLKNEPGTLKFDVLRPREEPDKVLLYEVYRDYPAFKEHWDGPLVTQVREEMKGMIIKLSGTPCTIQE